MKVGDKITVTGRLTILRENHTILPIVFDNEVIEIVKESSVHLGKGSVYLYIKNDRVTELTGEQTPMIRKCELVALTEPKMRPLEWAERHVLVGKTIRLKNEAQHLLNSPFTARGVYPSTDEHCILGFRLESNIRVSSEDEYTSVLADASKNSAAGCVIVMSSATYSDFKSISFIDLFNCYEIVCAEGSTRDIGIDNG